MNTPTAIAAGPGDRLFVADMGNSRIEVFDPSGTVLFAWGSPGARRWPVRIRIRRRRRLPGHRLCGRERPERPDSGVERGRAAPTISDVIDSVERLGLPHGIENSISAKLRAAQGSLGRGNSTAACGQLGAAIAELGALGGKKLPADSVEGLVAEIRESWASPRCSPVSLPACDRL